MILATVTLGIQHGVLKRTRHMCVKFTSQLYGVNDAPLDSHCMFGVQQCVKLLHCLSMEIHVIGYQLNTFPRILPQKIV